MYDLRNLRRTISEATTTLKEKLIEKLPELKISSYVEDMYLFSLLYYKPKIPPLPSCEMSLDFSPPFPRWFIWGSSLNDLKISYKKLAQRVVLTKFDIYNYRGHLHVDISHVKVLCDTIDGEALRFVGL